MTNRMQCRLKPFLMVLLLPLVLASCSNKPSSIGIQPFGAIDHVLMDSIKHRLQESYDTPVYVLTAKALPEHAFINTKSPRYRADSLLVYLRSTKPDSMDLVIGLTTQDISCTKYDADGQVKKPEWKYADWGVFGLGYRPGPSCVVSTFRLKHPDRTTFVQRLLKVATHEIGHNMGLAHCPTKGCVMQDAVESIRTVDQEGTQLCDRCRQRL